MLKSKEKAKRFRKIIVILIAITMILGIYIKEIYTQKREIKTIGVDQIQHMDATISAGNGTINPIYRPKWTKTSSTLNTDAQTLSIVVKGNASESQTVNGANIKYNSDVTSALSADDIIVYVDGELDGDTNKNGVLDEGETPSITKAVSTADSSATSAEVTHTITLSNFGEALRQEGKEFREWSGNVAIKIGGRGQDESTYSANVLTDKYGNENMMETDMDGTNDDGSWVSVIFKDGSIDHNANGTMFTDFVKPEFTYEYANTVIDHDTKTVTVVFDVTDKYFASTVLATDPQAENITVKLDGKEATNATKTLIKLSDITATVNGNTSTKIGEKYQLVVSNLDQGQGGDYSGIMTLCFNEGAITDTAGNGNVAKVITIGVDEPRKGVKPSELFDSTGSDTNKLHIGDFINYDAGTWTQEEINSIQTGLKTNLQTANGSTALPANAHQFGGFTAGSSRNGNSTPSDSTYNYIKDKSTGSAITGWRVFDIDGDNVTLISAGNLEDYCHLLDVNSAFEDEYILTGNVNNSWNNYGLSSYQKRDWGLYVNKSQKAQSAVPITKARLDSWYTKYIGITNADTLDLATFQKIYQESYVKYQNIIENYSNYWLSDADYDSYLNNVGADTRSVNGRTNASYKFGVRMLVTLSSDVLLSSQKTGTKTLTGGNMDTYGGEQTYNCWNIVAATEGESGSKDPVIVDVVDPIWKVENVRQDTENKKVTLDLIATDKYLTGVENSTLTTDDITISVDGDENANNVITKTLSKPTFSSNKTTGLKEIRYTLTLENWEESAKQAGKSFLEYSGSTKIKINAGTVVDDIGEIGNMKPSYLFDKNGTNEDGLHIGDFVDYDAGTWTQQEINSIQTGLKTSLQRANGSNSLPTNTYQFGGFTAGSSRNGSAIRAYMRSVYGNEYGSYLYDTSTNDILAGWRIFDIDGDTVTLISAGNPEDYYHAYDSTNDAFASQYILTGKMDPKWNKTESSAASTYQKRDWSVYVNSAQKAVSATPVTYSKINDWYEKYTKNGGTEGEINRPFAKLYNEPYIKYQNIADNYSVYWMITEQQYPMTVMRTK